jgi:HlyD family secretion protein
VTAAAPNRRLTILGLALLLGACGSSVPVPLYEVARSDWSHRVLAEGFLVAEEVTHVVVPAEVRHGGRILWIEEDGKEVKAGQVVMRLDHYELEQRLEADVAELQTADVEQRRTGVEGRSSVDTAITRKDLAGFELDHAERYRRDDEAVFSRSEIIDSQIEEELARTRRGRAAELEEIQGDRARAQTERVEVTRRVASLEVDLARAALSALELRAPRAGILIWSRDWRGETSQIGEQVFRGQVMAEIPDLSGLEAEVFVLEADADGVAAGRPATVTLDAHPDRAYEARVIRVDPIARRRFRGSPAQYLGVTLAIADPDTALMKPGQRVTASILIDEEPDALVIPRLALFIDDGGYFVYLARDRAFARQEVEVRRVAPGLALLGGGVEEGDLVALEVPAATAAAAAGDGAATSG